MSVDGDELIHIHHKVSLYPSNNSTVLDDLGLDVESQRLGLALGLEITVVVKVKVRVNVKCIYIAPSREISKALRHGSHSFTCKQHHARKRLPDGAIADCGQRHLIAAYYSLIDPETMKG